jgi:hypothetical protein
MRSQIFKIILYFLKFYQMSVYCVHGWKQKMRNCLKYQTERGKGPLEKNCDSFKKQWKTVERGTQENTVTGSTAKTWELQSAYG